MTRIRRHLSDCEKICIIALHEFGALSETSVAKLLRVSRKSVNRWIKRWQAECSLKERHHTGRKHSLSNAAQRRAYTLLMKTGCDSATHVAAMLKAARLTRRTVSRTTVIKGACAYAKKAGLARPVAVHTRPKRRLSTEHKEARLQFAESNITTDWSRTLFTDRVKFSLDKPGVKYHKKIWKPAGSEWSEFTTAKPGVYYNVYGGVSINGTTCLIPVTGTTGHKGRRMYKTKLGDTAKGITQSEYRDVLWRLLKEGTKLFKGKPWQLMQDGDKAHM
jgi:transposase